MMNKLLFLLLLACFPLASFADINLEPLLNKVTLQLHATTWVTTQTALVRVGINAAVTDQAIENLQMQILKKLNGLSDQGEWHILSFDRQQDQSGLESVRAVAEARLPQTAMSGLRDKAKAMSKPGETFTIDDVQFTPSEVEIQQAQTQLRNDLYQQAKAEIDKLNKAYPEQKYYLHQIDFMSMPMPMMRNTVAMAKAEQAEPLNIGNKVELHATVALTATPEIMEKLAH